MHVAEAFSEWIFHSAHFAIIPLPLVLGWHGHFREMLAKVQGRAPRPPCAQSDIQQVRLCTTVGGECPSFHGTSRSNRENRRWLQPYDAPDRGGADSDGYSTASEAHSTHRCRRRRKGEKRLASACLDMPIFKSTDPNMDVTYTLWRFYVQGW